MAKKYKHDNASLSRFQEQVCYGTLLGDSSLSVPASGRNYHLSCYHTEAQIEWLRMKWAWLQPHTRPIQTCEYTDKRNGKTYRGARFHTISAACFTALAQILYPDGKKRITLELKEHIEQPAALACLICDDGSWDGAGIAIASKQFTEEENHILAAILGSVFDLEIGVLCHGGYSFVRITSASVERALNLCQPYIPDMMLYKFGGGDYSTTLTGKISKVCPICEEPFESYESANQRYCSRQCAGVGKLKGYQAARQTKVCPLCGEDFKAYTHTQKTCLTCRDKPFPDEICIVCGQPVQRRGNLSCSKRCSVIAGHRARKTSR